MESRCRLEQIDSMSQRKDFCPGAEPESGTHTRMLPLQWRRDSRTIHILLKTCASEHSVPYRRRTMMSCTEGFGTTRVHRSWPSTGPFVLQSYKWLDHGFQVNPFVSLNRYCIWHCVLTVIERHMISHELMSSTQARGRARISLLLFRARIGLPVRKQYTQSYVKNRHSGLLSDDGLPLPISPLIDLPQPSTSLLSFAVRFSFLDHDKIPYHHRTCHINRIDRSLGQQVTLDESQGHSHEQN